MMPAPGQDTGLVRLFRVVMHAYGIVFVAQLGAFIIISILAHPLKSLVLIAAFGGLTLLFAHTSQLLTFITTQAHRLSGAEISDGISMRR